MFPNKDINIYIREGGGGVVYFYILNVIAFLILDPWFIVVWSGEEKMVTLVF